MDETVGNIDDNKKTTASSVSAPHTLSDGNDSSSSQIIKLKNEMLSLILSFLLDEKLYSAAMVLKDEANMLVNDTLSKRSQLLRMRKLIINGDWSNGHILLSKLTSSNRRRFEYNLYKQEYLEIINSTENGRAFEFLTKYLKPLEDIARTHNDEFKQLCYLLTCKTVCECDAFRDWRDPIIQRGIVADTICDSLNAYFQSDINEMSISSNLNHKRLAENNRLLSLMQQALLYQASCKTPSNTVHNDCNGHTEHMSLYENYKPSLVPYVPLAFLKVHQCHQLKCMSIKDSVQNESVSRKQGSSSIVIGGTDKGFITMWEHNRSNECSKNDTDKKPIMLLPSCTMRIVPTSFADGASYTCVKHFADAKDELEDSDMSQILYPPKIRNISVAPVGDTCAASLSDGNIILLKIDHSSDKISNNIGSHEYQQYNDSNYSMSTINIFNAHESDIYSSCYHPTGNFIASGGVDKSIALHDIETSKLLKRLTGHTGSVTHTSFNSIGNLIVSSSRDGSVRFWDCLSGLCVNTITPTTFLSASASKPSHSNSTSKVIMQSPGEITSATLSSDGYSLLVTSRFSATRIVDIRTNTVTSRFISSSAPSVTSNRHTPIPTIRMNESSDIFYRSCFCGGGKYVATGCAAGTINIWNGQVGRLEKSLNVYDDIHMPSTTISGRDSVKSSIWNTSYDSTLGILYAASAAGICLYGCNF